MLYYDFYGYERFKACFGLEKRDNGTVVRKNRILLNHLKNPALLRYCREHNDYALLHIYDMADLQKKVMDAVIESGKGDKKLPYRVELIGKTYHSSRYQTDESKGVCEDLDKSSVRYINVERSRVFKMRAGKFMRELILETEIGKLLSPSVVNWIAGDVFTQQWCTYTHGKSPDMELHINNEFWKIYDSDYCKGNFGSCMVDRERTSFYRDSVKAKAAYITDKTETIVLGCTHYPFLRPHLREFLGNRRIEIIDGSMGTAKELKRRLGEKNLLHAEKREQKIIFENSMEKQEMIDLSWQLLRLPID